MMILFRSMQSMADVVLLRIGVGSFPSLQLGGSEKPDVLCRFALTGT